MSVSYVSEGESPQASDHRALTAELDGILTCLFGGLSPLVYLDLTVDSDDIIESDLFGDTFFFGDSAEWKIIPNFRPLATEYDHSVFTTAAAALTVDHTDNTNGIAFVLDGSPWPLDGSLEAHVVNMVGDGEVDPRDFYLGQKNNVTEAFLTREKHRKLDVAEIIIEGWDSASDFDWDTAWDKYHFLRFHNLDPYALTVNLPGSVTITIPAFGCQAVRRTYPVGSTWDYSYTYLWRCESGDSLLFDAYRANNVASLLCFHDWLDIDVVNLAAGRGIGMHFDPTVVWDGSSVLHTTLTGSRRLGELYYHLGEFLSFEEADTVGTPATATPATWADLEGAGVAGLKATVAVDETKITIEPTGVEPVDACGVSTNLLPWHTSELPIDRFFSHTHIGYGAAKEGSTTLTYSWDDGTPHVVTIDVDFSESMGVSADVSTTKAWSTLTDHATMTYTGTPAVTLPTIEWKTDGWRVVGCGTVVFPASIGFIPSNTELATITDTTLSIPFGTDILNRTTWDIMNIRGGRKLSDYEGVTSGGIVYHDGNPDVTGTYGLPDGIDWVEDRQANTDSTYVRSEANTPQQDTFTIPVRVRGDAADRLYAERETAGWYVTNRADMLAATITEEDQQKVIKVVILREHYNHVAQRLNSVKAIRPFTFREAWYYGQIEDGGASPFKGSLSPTGLFCYVLATGSRADELGITVNSSTGPPPSGVGTVTGYWVSVEDVADYAESLGFRFALERLEMPLHYTTAIAVVSDDFADPWRRFVESDSVVANTPDGDYLGTNYGPVGLAACLPAYYTSFSPVVKCDITFRNTVSTPSGWTVDSTSRVLIQPIGVVQFSNDPVSMFPIGAVLGDEPGETVDPESIATEFHPVSDFSSGITPDSIATNASHTLASDKAAFRVVLIKRHLYVRS